MSVRLKTLLWALGISLVGFGCAAGGSASPMASPAGAPPPASKGAAVGDGNYAQQQPGYPVSESPAADQAGGGAEASAVAPATAPGGGVGAMGGARASATSAAPSRERKSNDDSGPANRPGLGTAWGENRESRTTTAPFIRDESGRPFASAVLWYNDREGANAMSRWADYRSFDRSVSPVLGGALTVSIRDERGNVLPGFYAGSKQYVIGEAGSRYAIIVQNNTSYRFEVVASVDGLDVIDGREAAYTKRGYIIAPNGMLEIDGFRRSSDAVAAFRFSSVRGSYSARSGQGDRNVGVVGVAFFNERGVTPTWTREEIDRRHQADPFPGRYAVPPSN